MPWKRYTLYSPTRGFYASETKGAYAAVTTMRIVGRLDCHSGKRAHKKNRIFIETLEHKPSGYRRCKICKPGVIRVGDKLGHLERRTAALLAKPHIAVWATGGLTKGPDMRGDPLPERWYVCMNWNPSNDDDSIVQGTLTKHMRHGAALRTARRIGRKLNLPVVKHSDDYIGYVTVLALPTRRSTKAERDAVLAAQQLVTDANGISEPISLLRVVSG